MFESLFFLFDGVWELEQARQTLRDFASGAVSALEPLATQNGPKIKAVVTAQVNLLGEIRHRVSKFGEETQR